VQTNVLIKEKCILKSKNKLCPFKQLSVFYNSCLKTFGSHFVHNIYIWYHVLYLPVVCKLCVFIVTFMYSYCSIWVFLFLGIIFSLYSVSMCCSVYCLCVNVCCTAVLCVLFVCKCALHCCVVCTVCV
jgi:hypothetical protein